MSSEQTINGFFAVLNRRRNILIRTVSVFIVLGIIACFVLKPRYRAVSEIEIQKSVTDGLGLDNLTSTAASSSDASDALDATLAVQTEAKILESDGLALKVIQDLNLESTEDFAKLSPIDWVLKMLTPAGTPDPAGTSLENAPHRREHVLKIFSKHLKVKPQVGTRLIDIEYVSHDPKIAAAVANDLSKSLVDYTVALRFEATAQVAGWLQSQLGSIRDQATKLQAKSEALQRDAGVYSMGVTDAQGREEAYNSTLDRLQQATTALSAAESNRIMKGGLYKMVQDGNPELISGLAGSALAGSSAAMNNSFQLLQNLRAQQASLSSQYAADVSRLGTENPKLIDEKASLDDVNSQIKAEVGRIGERAANDYKAAQVVEKNTRSIYDREQRLANQGSSKAVALLIAQQEASDARTLYQTLFSHLKGAGFLQGMRSSNVSIVDPGRVPYKPLPDIPKILAVSVFCGCFFGVAAVLFANATDNRIEAMATIEHALHTNILGVLPLAPTISGENGQNRFGLNIRRRFAEKIAQGENSKLVILEGSNTAYGEALRALRTSLLNPAEGPAPKTILITSASEQEGKSTLSLNLAAALALTRSRILLIDADMRSAGLSAYMGFERRPSGLMDHNVSGLSDALAGNGEPAILAPFPELPSLFVLPAGPVPTYPAELLGSDRMKSFLEKWHADYDYVVIDSPPILAVTDAHILSNLVETTLLVARHGHSTQKSIERAYQTLNDVPNRKVDVVVNGVNRNSSSYGDFYGYRGTSYYSEV